MLSEVMYDFPDTVNLMPAEGNTGLKSLHEKGRDVLPTDRAPVLCSHAESRLALTPSDWGFAYMHEGKKMLAVNARSESAAQKMLFSQAMHEKRCVIPVSAFYEYTKDKQKVTFRGERPVLYLAGCMRADHFVILTKEPDSVVAPVHDRMPVILGKENVEEWIQAKNVPSHLIGESTHFLQASMPYQQMSLFDL